MDFFDSQKRLSDFSQFVRGLGPDNADYLISFRLGQPLQPIQQADDSSQATECNSEILSVSVCNDGGNLAVNSSDRPSNQGKDVLNALSVISNLLELGSARESGQPIESCTPNTETKLEELSTVGCSEESTVPKNVGTETDYKLKKSLKYRTLHNLKKLLMRTNKVPLKKWLKIVGARNRSRSLNSGRLGAGYVDSSTQCGRRAISPNRSSVRPSTSSCAQTQPVSRSEGHSPTRQRSGNVDECWTCVPRTPRIAVKRDINFDDDVRYEGSQHRCDRQPQQQQHQQHQPRSQQQKVRNERYKNQPAPCRTEAAARSYDNEDAPRTAAPRRREQAARSPPRTPAPRRREQAARSPPRTAAPRRTQQVARSPPLTATQRSTQKRPKKHPRWCSWCSPAQKNAPRKVSSSNSSSSNHSKADQVECVKIGGDDCQLDCERINKLLKEMAELEAEMRSREMNADQVCILAARVSELYAAVDQIKQSYSTCVNARKSAASQTNCSCGDQAAPHTEMPSASPVCQPVAGPPVPSTPVSPARSQADNEPARSAVNVPSTPCINCERCGNRGLFKTNLRATIVRIIENRPCNSVVLTVLLQADNIYHINVRDLATGESLGCVFATDEGITEAQNMNLFNDILTFFVVDSRNTKRKNDRPLGHAFELVSDNGQQLQPQQKPPCHQHGGANNHKHSNNNVDAARSTDGIVLPT